MEVKPVKKYKKPSYPALARIKDKEIYKDNGFSPRQKLLIAVASLVLFGSLTGCVTEGTPAPTQLPGAPPLDQSATEYDIYDALKTTVAADNVAKHTTLSQLVTTHAAEVTSQSIIMDSMWNEEPDIRAAFDEFLNWMRNEGVI